MHQRTANNEQLGHNIALNLSGLLSVSIFLLFLSLTSCVFGSSFDSPAAVTDSSSAMYTVDDVYNRLNTGTAGGKRTTIFTEPAGAPASATHDLNEVMAVAPTVDNTNGASAAEVANSKTFWSLQSGNWGLQTGTATIAINPAVVPKTGQNLCYKTDGATGTIACAGTGQDGELEKGIAHASPRFTKHVNTADDDGSGVAGIAANGLCDGTETCNGTVTDNSTGLIWLLNANCANTTLNWAIAFIDISSLNTNGTMNNKNCGDISNGGAQQTDWRLPNIKELQSLIDFQNIGLALPTGHPFSSVVPNNYWSSTTNVDRTGSAWNIYLVSGYVDYDNKVDFNYVWPVRGRQ